MKPTKPIVVYTVHETTDEYGRIGRLLGVTLDHDLARKLAKGRGAWTDDGAVSEKHYMEGEDGVFYELLTPVPVKVDIDAIRKVDAVRKSALGKLTDEEAATLLNKL